MVIDPVYKMLVYPEKAAATAEQSGEIYYFCSSGYKTEFDEDPSGYIGRGYKNMMVHCGSCGH